MHYGEIKNCDIANGIGVRVSLFVSGCTHHCHNCFNPETWNFSYGSPFDEQAQSKLLTMLSPDYIDGLSLLGGEPFEPDNQRALLRRLICSDRCSRISDISPAFPLQLRFPRIHHNSKPGSGVPTRAVWKYTSP